MFCDGSSKRLRGLALGFSLFAATAAGLPAQAQDSSESPLQLRNAMGTVLVSGLVGGVLGLSTLSFYTRPQDNIRNIFFGAGAGMILATIVMTADVAQAPTPNVKNSLPPAFDIRIAPVIAPDAGGVAVAIRF